MKYFSLKHLTDEIRRLINNNPKKYCDGAKHRTEAGERERVDRAQMINKIPSMCVNIIMFTQFNAP